MATEPSSEVQEHKWIRYMTEAFSDIVVAVLYKFTWARPMGIIASSD